MSTVGAGRDSGVNALSSRREQTVRAICVSSSWVGGTGSVVTLILPRSLWSQRTRSGLSSTSARLSPGARWCDAYVPPHLARWGHGWNTRPAREGGHRAAQAATSSPTYYVSLGDSYSVGYQPGLGATPGYAGYVAAHTGLTLKNFGCSGATTTSILLTMGCPIPLQHTAGGVSYPTRTQVAAADAFIVAHRGHIGLITVTIGANDVAGCGAVSDPIACVRSVASKIQTNVTTLATVLRAAAGPGVPLIGSTYPDVILGALVHPMVPPSAFWVNLVQLSGVAFRLLVNPSLAKSYSSAGGYWSTSRRPLTPTCRSAG